MAWRFPKGRKQCPVSMTARSAQAGGFFVRSRPGWTAVRILGFAWFGCFVAMHPAFATPGDVLVVDIEQADLRTAPDPTAPALLRAPRGLRLIEFERRGGWVRVRVFGRLGKDAWIHESLVSRKPLSGQGLVLPRIPTPAESEPPVEEDPATGRRSFLLVISGSPALKFRGRCRVLDHQGRDERVDFGGLVPRHIVLTGSALSCRVRKEDFFGRLRVALQEQGRVIAHAKTTAPFNNVRVRSAGPWGPAGGIRGVTRIPRFSFEPSMRRRTVPPLSGMIIPPLSGRILPPLARPERLGRADPCRHAGECAASGRRRGRLRGVGQGSPANLP